MVLPLRVCREEKSALQQMPVYKDRCPCTIHNGHRAECYTELSRRVELFFSMYTKG